MQTGRLGTLVGFSLQVCGAGAAMIWPNEKWIGVAIFAVGLVTAVISLVVWFNSNYRVRTPWTKKEGPSAPMLPAQSSPPVGNPLLVDADKFGSPTVTQLPPTLAVGLYVSDIRFTFDDLEKNRRGELTMRVFNGTGRAIEFSSLSGRITFSAPNSTDPERKGSLPTPTLRHDVVKVAYPLQEWFFILEQHVPAQDADKLLAMIAANIAIHFDLTGLDLSVFPQGEPKKLERLPLWGGFSCRHGICFGRIIDAVAHIGGVSTG